MKRKVMLSALLLIAQASVAEDSSTGSEHIGQKALNFVMDNIAHASAAAVVAAIIARPVYHLIMDKLVHKNECSCYALDSVVGASIEKKEDGRVKVQAHVGSVDAKVSVPTSKAFPLGEKKRSAQALLNEFKPHFEIGIDDKKTPLVSDQTAVDASKVKRLFAKFSLGPWSARVACDVTDLLVVPAAMIAMHLIQEIMPSAMISTPMDLIAPATTVSEAGEAQA